MLKLFCAVLLMALPAAATATKAPYPVSAFDGWATPSRTGSSVGVGFLTIRNHADHALKLLSATGEVSEVIELHDHISENGVMKMRKMDAITLAPFETVALKPHGKHLMLIGLKQTLKEGDSFILTLQFDEGEPMPVQFTVKPIQ